jgi:shikimate kinase
MTKIFLIGMPGAGKTTLGKKLAEYLRVRFVDLDAEIQESEGKPIPEIFSQHGEEYFRRVESRLLREWATGEEAFVMATGGGAPCFHEGMEVINRYGTSVFLDCSVDELLERVKRNKERPLLLTSSEDELRAKLERMRELRWDCYRQAKITLEEPSLDDVLSALAVRK